MASKKPEGLAVRSTPIRDIDPAPYNPRKIDPEQLAHLERSIREFGFVDPVIVNADGTLIGGHQRIKAAKRIGMTEVPAVHVDLDKTREKALNVALNKIAGTWDEPMLVKVLTELDADGYDVSFTGFETSEIEKMMARLEAERKETTEPEPPTNPITKLGDLYQIGEHRLLCGDATDPEQLDRLMAGADAHLVFTDPPYGVTYEDRRTGGDYQEFDVIKGDDLRDDALVNFLVEAIKNAARVSTDTAAFYIWHSQTTRREFERALDLAGLLEIAYIVWTKDNFVLSGSDYHSQYEPCFYAEKAGQDARWQGRRDESTVWTITRAIGEGETAAALGPGLKLTAGDDELYLAPSAPKSKKLRRLRLETGESITIAPSNDDGDVWHVRRDPIRGYKHPTQKPVALSARALRNSTDRGDIVLDIFAGSGSTLEGAHETGRRAYLMELDPAYCDVITARAERLGLEVHLAEPATS